MFLEVLDQYLGGESDAATTCGLTSGQGGRTAPFRFSVGGISTGISRDLGPGSVRLTPVGVGHLWGIRTEVIGGRGVSAGHGLAVLGL